MDISTSEGLSLPKYTQPHPGNKSIHDPHAFGDHSHVSAAYDGLNLDEDPTSTWMIQNQPRRGVDKENYHTTQNLLEGMDSIIGPTVPVEESTLSIEMFHPIPEIFDSAPYGNHCGEVVNTVASKAYTLQEDQETDQAMIAEFYDKIKQWMYLCFKLECSESVTEVKPFQSEIRIDSYSAIGIQCFMDESKALSGRSVSVGSTSYDQSQQLLTFKTQQAIATLPSDFYKKCGSYCSEDVLGISLQFFTDPSLHEAVLGSLTPSPNAVNATIVSGVLSTQLSHHLGGLEICPSRACRMIGQIPVDASKYDATKVTDCMRIQDGNAIGGTSGSGISFTGYDQKSGLARCESTMLGEIFVVQYVTASTPILPLKMRKLLSGSSASHSSPSEAAEPTKTVV